MSLPRFAVRRPVATVMFYLAVCLAGAFSFWRLPVDLMPNASAGSLTIFIGIRGGLPPEDIENLVTKIVEEAVSTVQHLRSVLSVSRKDRSVVTLTYEPGTDLAVASLEVQERMAKIKNKLPKDIEKPVVAHYGENDYPVIILALTSDKYKPEALRERADNALKPRLMRVNGVANVEIGGGQERKILVEFDQARLEAYQIPIREAIDIIGKNNLNLLTGKRREGTADYELRTMGQYKSLEELKNLVIRRSAEGTGLRLRDIAEVRDFYIEAQSKARLNRKDTVSIYVQKANDSNTLRVADRVRREARRVKEESLGPDIQMEIPTDQSIFIADAMANVRDNLSVGMLLTLGIIFLFIRDLRHTLIVFLSAPIAVLMTLAFMKAIGLSMNVMTLSAIALGIGIVVDSATVVLENIVEKKRHAAHAGGDPAEITVSATEELFVSLVGSTLTIVVVFLPIVFINQQVKILYSGLAYTITFSMAASLLVSVTLVPLLASRIPAPTHRGHLTPEGRERLERWAGRSWAGVPGWLGRPLLALGRRVRALFPGEKPAPDPAPAASLLARLRAAWYGRVWPAVLSELRFTRRHPRRAYLKWACASIRHQKWIAAGVALAALLAVGLYVYVIDKDFLGQTEQNEFIIFVELPAGAKLDISDQVVRDVERILHELPDVSETVKTSAARVEGWSSKVYVTLRPRAERSRSVEDVIQYLRPKVADIGQQYDSFVYFSEPEASKEFFVDVFGPEYDVLRDVASAIAQKLQSVRGLEDVKLRYKPGQPEVQVKVDKDLAAMFDFTVKDVAEDLHARIRGLRPTWFFQDAQQLEIIARDQEQFRKSLEDINYISLVAPGGENVSIRQIADFEFSLTPSEVWRKDKQRVIQVSANREKLALSKAARKALAAMRELDIPTGYYYQIGGDYSDMMQNEREFRFAFIIMAGLVFIVLASLFESYVHALIIMGTIPMALIGSIPLLWLTRTPATMSVYIGTIMLGGIAVTAAIILVDKMNLVRREDGRPLARAVLQGSYVRLLAILNTSLTTIVDLIPMAMSRSESAQLWAPLALTVIGGTTVSTFLTLFMIPGLYFHAEVFLARVRARSPLPAAVPAPVA